jgi:hypothetical protein
VHRDQTPPKAAPRLGRVELARDAAGPGTYSWFDGYLELGVAGITQVNNLGFRLVAVPEPSTYVMALAGLAGGGYSLVRRRRSRPGYTCQARQSSRST